MDLSQVFVHPAILVFIASGAVAFIVWLVRLESKTGSCDDALGKFKTEIRQEVKELEEELKDTRTRFFEHAANAAVHHNVEAYLEFKNGLERRLIAIESGIKDIGVEMKHRNQQ